MTREQHRMVDTSYGEVMVKPSDTPNLLECYIGDNYDNCIGEIEGDLSEGNDSLAITIENELF